MIIKQDKKNKMSSKQRKFPNYFESKKLDSYEKEEIIKGTGKFLSNYYGRNQCIRDKHIFPL